MTTATIALMSRTRPQAPLLTDIVRRAQSGDQDALMYVFDNVFYDVYHFVLLATHDRGDAERVTRDALNRLPGMVRSGRFQSVEALRESLVHQATQRLRINHRTKAPVGGMSGLRAVIRHAVLISSAAIAATGALILVS